MVKHKLLNRSSSLHFVAATLGFAVLFLFLWRPVGVAQEPEASTAEAAEATGAAARIRSLQVELRDTLRTVVESMRLQLDAGRIMLADLQAPLERLMEAELALAENWERKISLLEENVQRLKDHEASTQRLAEMGRTDVFSLSRAKAGRLEGEIRLERARVSSLEDGD